jgi:SAM-dependent MidA family methyltransferase
MALEGADRRGHPDHASRMIDDFALAARTPLTGLVVDEIRRHGPITFARFMALALGHPEHGYYARPGLRWGTVGDFQTSPEVHPVFGYLWARQLQQCWELLGRPTPFDIVEVGAGSGALAEAMLTWLRERAPECFAAARPLLLDAQAGRVVEQRSRLHAAGLDARHALIDEWLEQPDVVAGVIISNECFDAMPVHLIERQGGALQEWHVTIDERNSLAFELREVSTPRLGEHFARLGVTLGADCRAEVSFAALDLMRALASRLTRGHVISIDYGHDAPTLYAPWRRMGTLMAFRDHSPQPDPLALPGLTDLTAHVDLTSLAQAAQDAGCEVAPHVSQAEALAALGIGEVLEAARERAGADLAAYAAARRAVETLLDPAGLGRIRVLVAAKGAPLSLLCLAPLP